MNSELMIDTINLITEKSQSLIEQLIRKDKPIHQKMQFVSLYLNQMKSEIFQWISNILSQSKEIKYIALKLNQLKSATDQQIAKNRLHIFLKKRLQKLKKQSFLYSMESNQNFLHEDSKILDLEKSVLNIQKDLNITQQQEDILGISSIIQKSRMLNLDQSALKDQPNVSVISEYEILGINSTQKTQKKSTQQQQTINLSKFSLTELIEKDKNTTEQMIQMKQNEQKNLIRSVVGQNQKNQGSKEKAQVSKVMKKKKKNVYSTAAYTTNLNKQDLLGKILEECLENQTK